MLSRSSASARKERKTTLSRPAGNINRSWRTRGGNANPALVFEADIDLPSFLWLEGLIVKRLWRQFPDAPGSRLYVAYRVEDDDGQPDLVCIDMPTDNYPGSVSIILQGRTEEDILYFECIGQITPLYIRAPDKTISVNVSLDNPKGWIDVNGKTPTAATLKTALDNITRLGLCFGGPKRPDSGVVCLGGSARFHITTFEIK